MIDTLPQIAAIVRDRIMARSGFERMVMGSEMFEVARTMILASLPPDLSVVEISRHLCARLYGNEVDVDSFVASVRARGLL